MPMSLRRIALVLLLPAALLVATPRFAACAGDPAPPSSGQPSSAQFTPDQRQEIVAIIREALKSDPSLLRDGILALKAEEEDRAKVEAGAALADSGPALLHDAADATLGNPAGDVTVVEFYDIRCPYCRRVEPTLAQLLQQDPRVRLVIKEFPILGPSSVLGARALLAAQRQGGYDRLHAALMRESAGPTDESLRADAKALGLDWARLQRDMADPAIGRKIDDNLALAHRLGIEGTPAFVIGETIVPGAVSLADLKRAVAAARAH